MRDFRELKVWEKAHQLTLGVYRSTARFPPDERFGLTSQMRRSASSIPTNIAEGCGRSSQANFVHFLDIAMGSASETEYHLLLCHDLGFLGDEEYLSLGGAVTEVKKMLTGLILKLKADG
jgi:four helix bundle protein